VLKGFGIGDISIDCTDPVRTREFYAKMSGWTQRELYNCPALTDGNGFTVLFMGCDFTYEPPVWHASYPDRSVPFDAKKGA